MERRRPGFLRSWHDKVQTHRFNLPKPAARGDHYGPLLITEFAVVLAVLLILGATAGLGLICSRKG